MTWTIENALEDQNLTRASFLYAEYKIIIGDLPEVTIKIWKLLKGDAGYYSTQSHYIHTPTQGGPHIGDTHLTDEAAYALHLALGTLIPHYNAALAQGHAPSDTWLKVNTSF